MDEKSVIINPIFLWDVRILIQNVVNAPKTENKNCRIISLLLDVSDAEFFFFSVLFSN